MQIRQHHPRTETRADQWLALACENLVRGESCPLINGGFSRGSSSICEPLLALETCETRLTLDIMTMAAVKHGNTKTTLLLLPSS